MELIRRLLLLAVTFTLLGSAFAVEPASRCAITPIKTDPKQVNIFTPDQEVYLGEIIADRYGNSGSIVDDDTLNAYLTQIGQRLVKKLPPTGLDFRFYVYDSPEANGYSISGGRVYITRKLILFAHTEDEVAGVVAHELGHIVTHQQAIEYSKIFKEKIGVTGFTDRADLLAKYHQMLESKKSVTVSREDDQEEADRVGLDILVRAGYHPEELTAFWDRFTANKGKRGNWFTDVFGNTGEVSRRYREMLKETVQLPTECIDKRDPDSEQVFKKWQSLVASYDRYNRREKIPGLLAKKTLEPPLQDQLHTLRFSYDGKYILGQDNGSIYILDRDPLKVRFMIPAEEAFPAHFTSDSKFVTFYTPDLHAEVWDIEGQRATRTFDLHSAYGCMQTALSPDASTLACIDMKENLVLIDSATQDRIFEKKDIRSGNADFTFMSGYMRYSYEIQYVNLGFSPDGKYLLFSGSRNAFGVDVANRKEISLPGNVKSAIKHAFTFLDNDRIFGLAEQNGARGLLVGFPDGKLIDSLPFGGAVPGSVTRGDYVLMRPIRDYEVGVYNLKSHEIVRANKKPAMDIFGELAVSETASGEVAIFADKPEPVAHVSLPRGRLAGVRAAAVSPDFQWLALAEEERGAIWNLATGQRLYNLKTFKGAYFGSDGAYVDFPKQAKMERSVAKLNLGQPGMSLAAKLGPGKISDRGAFLLTWQAKNDKAKDDEEEKGMERFNRYRYEGSNLRWHDIFKMPDSNETLEVRDTRNGNVLWSRHFDKDVPRLFTNSDAAVISFVWRVGQPGAKGEFEKIPTLEQKKASAKDNDYLVEVVDLQTGSVLGGIVIETNEGTFHPTSILATRSWVVVTDSFSRVLNYNLKTHACTGKVFGTPVELSADSNHLIVRHDSRRFTLYDTETMAERENYVFSAPVTSLQMSRGGDRFLAVTSDQTVYVVNAKVKGTEQAGAN